MQEAQELTVQWEVALPASTLCLTLFSNQITGCLLQALTHSLRVSHIQLVDVPILSPCQNVGA